MNKDWRSMEMTMKDQGTCLQLEKQMVGTYIWMDQVVAHVQK
jgi:hypothetical protein